MNRDYRQTARLPFRLWADAGSKDAALKRAAPGGGFHGRYLAALGLTAVLLAAFAALLALPLQAQTQTATTLVSNTGESTVHVGETLTADTSGIGDDDGLANVSYSYQWVRSDGAAGTNITGATHATYTLAIADESHTVKVKVTFTDDAGNEETLASAATATVAARPRPGSAPDAPDPAIGTAVFVGGVDLEWNDVAGADSYDVQLFQNGQWIDLPGGGVEIGFYGGGAIISELDPDGSSYWFHVRAKNAHGSSEWSDFNFVETTNESDTGRRARPDNVPASGTPVISGTAEIGETLTADTTGIEDGNGLDRVQFRFQWVSHDGSADTDIASATDSTYTLAASDEGKIIKVRVAFTDRGGYAESLTGVTTEQVVDSDEPKLSVSVTPQVVNENYGSATLTVSISNGVTFTDDQEIVLAFSGTASPDDYDVNGVPNVETATLNLAAGATSATATLLAIDDEDFCCDLLEEEADETVNVTASHRGVPVGSATFTIRDMAHDADLKSVKLPPLLSHQFSGFEPGSTTVTVVVNEQVRSVSVEAAANHPDATLSISPAAEVQLIVGPNEIVITVTAEDGYTTKTYTVTVILLLSPLTGELRFHLVDGEQQGHDGESGFKVRISFSEDVEITPEDMRDHALLVSGGTVTDAAGVYGRKNLWELTVEPAGTGPVFLLVPPDRACTEAGALCTADGRSLTSSLALRVPGPQAEPGNSPATGRPTIGGTVQVGEMLTASTSGIADDEGLTNVSYSYQWIRSDGSTDTDIQDATGSTHTLVDADEGKAIKVKVSFADDAANDESLTSGATAEVAARPNTPATGRPTIGGTVQVGEMLTASTSSIGDADGLTNVSYSYQWIRSDGSTDTDMDATGSTHTLVDADEGKAIKVKVSFADDLANDESLTSGATAEVAARPNTPVAEEPPLPVVSIVALASAVPENQWAWFRISRTGPTIEDLVVDTRQTFTRGADSEVESMQWRLRAGRSQRIVGTLVAGDDIVKGDLTITETLEPGEGYLVAADANSASVVVMEDDVASAVQKQTANTSATGKPTISGTVQVEETLTASTSGIADADGLTKVSYSYQWIRNDGSTDTDIQDATGSTHTLVDADEGKVIKVKVTFTDDAGNEEALTSGATDAVAAADPPAKPTGLSASVVSHEAVTLTWDDPQDDSITGYVIQRRDRAIHPVGTFVTIAGDTGSTDTTYTDATVEPDKQYVYRIKAINEHGEVSDKSDWIRADTPAIPIPDKPTGLSAVVSHEAVTLTWDDPQDDSITGYVIQRRDRAIHPVGTFVTLAGDTGSTDTTYTDDSVEPDKQYVYRIKAINEHGEVSDKSDWIRANTPNWATGAPTIGGNAQVGETLTADISEIADDDGLENAVFSYQWVASNGTTDTDIPDATDSTYDLN